MITLEVKKRLMKLDKKKLVELYQKIKESQRKNPNFSFDSFINSVKDGNLKKMLNEMEKMSVYSLDIFDSNIKKLLNK